RCPQESSCWSKCPLFRDARLIGKRSRSTSSDKYDLCGARKLGELGLENRTRRFLLEVAPVSWTPDYLGSRSPRWARQDQPTRLSSAARWLNWCGPAARRRSWRVSSNRRHSRSGTGWHSVSVTPVGATAA